MPPKRKASALDVAVLDSRSSEEPKAETTSAVAKKARVSRSTKANKAAAQAEDASGEKSSEPADASSKSAAPKSWRDVVLEGEGEDGGVPVYDDCNEIRRKIRLLQKEPGFKITHWLKDIGNINSNSFQRFMKAKGATGGASNGTYYAAYVFFEKKRIFEGKKKTPTRVRNESSHPAGFELQEHRYVWVPA